MESNAAAFTVVMCLCNTGYETVFSQPCEAADDEGG